MDINLSIRNWTNVSYWRFILQNILSKLKDVNEQRNLQLESEDNASQNRPMIVSGGEQSSGSSISKNMQSGNTTLTVDTTQVTQNNTFQLLCKINFKLNGKRDLLKDNFWIQIDSVPLTSITSATSDKTKDSGFSATSLVGGSSSDKSLSSGK